MHDQNTKAKLALAAGRESEPLTKLRCSAYMQVAYELRGFFRNFTGSSACYGEPSGGKPPADDRCHASSFAHVPFQGW